MAEFQTACKRNFAYGCLRPFAGFLITKEKAMPAKDPTRQMRSYRTCWLPAEEKPLRAPPRESGAYVPEMAARLEDDRNLTDGARRCARKLAEYIYRRNREGRAAEITVPYLLRALGACQEDDRNLTDGARRCARKLAEYIYRRNREGRAAEITVTYLMRALGKCRRTVQRYLSSE